VGDTIVIIILSTKRPPFALNREETIYTNQHGNMVGLCEFEFRFISD